MTEETLLEVPKCRTCTKFGVLLTVDECRRFSDWALSDVRAGETSFLELLLNERRLA